jgi:transposase-like protein
MEAGEESLQELLERRFDELDLLVIYLDGMVFGSQHVISAVGVDAEGHKHVLGIQQGATENAAAVEDLLWVWRTNQVRNRRREALPVNGTSSGRRRDVDGKPQAGLFGSGSAW